VPLVLAGPVAGIDEPAELRAGLAAGDVALTQHADVRFFLDEVAPLLEGDRVRWVGGVAGEAKERLLQPAVALLAPNRWPEPGATGVVEALSRGVPVVATQLGVLPSLVRHGETGFLAETEQDLARYLPMAAHLDADACRASVSGWTPAAMAERYIALYRRLLDSAPTRRTVAAAAG
jgi:glycosyltransferase involved in cell wall biosynthesis